MVNVDYPTAELGTNVFGQNPHVPSQNDKIGFYFSEQVVHRRKSFFVVVRPHRDASKIDAIAFCGFAEFVVILHDKYDVTGKLTGTPPPK